MQSTRRVQVIRGALAASIATFVALASHVWVGGAMPGMLGVAVPWTLSLMVCTVLAGRRLSVTRLAVSVIVSQLMFHVLFVLGGITPRTPLGAHEHGLPEVLSPLGSAAIVPEDAGMWIAHALAATVTIMLLYRGEQAVHAVVEAASAVAAWLRRTVTVRVLAPLPVGGSPRWMPVTAPLRGDPPHTPLSRRGPPLRLI